MSKVTDVDINPILKPETKIVALGRIVLNGDIVIDGIKIIRGSKGLFVGMPSRKSKEGTWSDVAYATTKELKQLIQDAAIENYNSKVAGEHPAAESSDDGDDLPF